MSKRKTYDNQELLKKKQELILERQDLNKKLLDKDILAKDIKELKRLIRNVANKINYINIKLSPERSERLRKNNIAKCKRYYAKKKKK